MSRDTTQHTALQFQLLVPRTPSALAHYKTNEIPSTEDPRTEHHSSTEYRYRSTVLAEQYKSPCFDHDLIALSTDMCLIDPSFLAKPI